jgi:ubiquinone/menaquinone biosynthesis C-methylase UbiE
VAKSAEGGARPASRRKQAFPSALWQHPGVLSLPAVRALLRCPRCRAALDDAPGGLCCPAGHGPILYEGGVLDFAPPGVGATSFGARVMASRWIAGVYERWWRPIAFGLSTGFRMPSRDEEAHIVLARLGSAPAPWLDLSCGPGTLTPRLVASAAGPVVALDASASMLARAREQVPCVTMGAPLPNPRGAFFVRADAAALPFADGAFGAVVNLAALDLYPDAARVVAESARVLAPRGRWVASTFLSSEIVTRSAPLRRALAITAGIHAVSAPSLATMAAGAGLVGFGEMRFGRYVVAWAEKPGIVAVNA